jgi:hypothetical protein
MTELGSYCVSGLDTSTTCSAPFLIFIQSCIPDMFTEFTREWDTLSFLFGKSCIGVVFHMQ